MRRDDHVYLYATDTIHRSHWNIQSRERSRLVSKGPARRKGRLSFLRRSPCPGPAALDDQHRRLPSGRQDAANGTHRIAASYNAPLRRYLLSAMTVDRLGHVAVFDVPEPWGPWSTVPFQQDTNRWGSKVIIATFANKWLGADGRRFVVVHTKDDSWASLEGEFTVVPGRPARSRTPPDRPALSSLRRNGRRENPSSGRPGTATTGGNDWATTTR